MEPWILAVIIRPFALLVLFVLIVLPIKYVVWRVMKDGKLKRILFTRFDQWRNPKH